MGLAAVAEIESKQHKDMSIIGYENYTLPIALTSGCRMSKDIEICKVCFVLYVTLGYDLQTCAQQLISDSSNGGIKLNGVEKRFGEF